MAAKVLNIGPWSISAEPILYWHDKAVQRTDLDSGPSKMSQILVCIVSIQCWANMLLEGVTVHLNLKRCHWGHLEFLHCSTSSPRWLVLISHCSTGLRWFLFAPVAPASQHQAMISFSYSWLSHVGGQHASKHICMLFSAMHYLLGCSGLQIFCKALHPEVWNADDMENELWIGYNAKGFTHSTFNARGQIQCWYVALQKPAYFSNLKTMSHLNFWNVQPEDPILVVCCDLGEVSRFWQAQTAFWIAGTALNAMHLVSLLFLQIQRLRSVVVVVDQ